MNRATTGGRDESPHIEWSDVPPLAKSFCLSLTDLDALPQPQTLWVVINIPYSVRALFPNASLATELLPSETVQLTNGLGNQRYDGPTLAQDSEAHRILIELRALSLPKLNIGLFTPPDERQKIIASNTIEVASLVALATRSQ